jgi:hypothetical protein
MEDIRRSAYWTLAEAGMIKHLSPCFPYTTHCTIFHPFPWGTEVHPPEEKINGILDIAVVHAYIWNRPVDSYHGAPDEAQVSRWVKRLAGYDAAVFGDNHKGFEAIQGQVFNCGTLMRRKADEISYRPSVGLLYADGSIKRHYLDTSKDVIEAVREPEKPEINMKSFIAELRNYGSDDIDFAEALNRWFKSNTITPRAKAIILEALNGD